jgi:hypothetical protein
LLPLSFLVSLSTLIESNEYAKPLIRQSTEFQITTDRLKDNLKGLCNGTVQATLMFRPLLTENTAMVMLKEAYPYSIKIAPRKKIGYLQIDRKNSIAQHSRRIGLYSKRSGICSTTVRFRPKYSYRLIGDTWEGLNLNEA